MVNFNFAARQTEHIETYQEDKQQRQAKICL